MAKKKYEFRPDRSGAGLLNKLYLTKKQRLQLLKWSLYALLLLVLSVLQDVILCRVSIFGATTDLVPCAIFLICVYQGAETGSVFALTAAAIYQFSGTAPGYYVIALIPAIGILAAAFRQGYLHKSTSSDLLCTVLALFLYEIILFCVAWATGLTAPARIGSLLVTVLLSGLTMPLLYPATHAIDKIGGETWKE